MINKNEVILAESVDLKLIVDFLSDMSGVHYIKPDKADREKEMSDVPAVLTSSQSDTQMNQVDFMKQLSAIGKKAREEFSKLGRIIGEEFPNYVIGTCSSWVTQAQKIPDYFWIEFKKEGFQESPSSISLFAWKYEDKVLLYVAVEARDNACKKEDFDKHNKLIYKEKIDTKIYYRVEVKKDDYQVMNCPREDIVKMLENHELMKIRAEVNIDGPFVSENISSIVKQIKEAFKILEPFYDVTIGDENMGSTTGSTTNNRVKTFVTTEALGINSILYGPPGTGKTYNTVRYAVAICDNKSFQELESIPYKELLDRYEQLKEEGRIAFTTFHQSYGYEEFIEGIKPATSEDSEGEIQYSIEPGVFKSFCDAVSRPKQVSIDNDIMTLDNPTIWKVSLQGGGKNEIKEQCFKGGYIRIGWSKLPKYIDYDIDCQGESNIVRDVLIDFQDNMSIGDIVLSLRTNDSIDAIGIITDEYEYDESCAEYKRKRKVKWIATDINESILSINGNKRLTQRTVYKLKRISLNDLMPIINKYQVQEDKHDKERNYVFIIDEINRGNISKIFGELITLIEKQKRLGMDEEVKVQLPYSQKEFGVPNNVYILGTMNTADRSISLLDTALRRRFNFIEMMPDYEVLKKLDIIDIDGINVVEMLKNINKRIECLYDREHTIGHAYFTPLAKDPSLKKLGKIFLNEIIPLLQEYFFEDYSKIQLVLGDNAKTDGAHKFILDDEIKMKDIFKGNPDIDLPEKKYTIQTDAFYKVESYKKIY